MSNPSKHMSRSILAASLIAVASLVAQQALAAQPTVEEKLEILQQEIEALKANTTHSAPKHGISGNTTLGGYGEMHLNKLKNRKPGGTNKDEIDFHRFVLFIGQEFNDRVRFHSELEIEHALVKDTDTDTVAGSTPKPNSGELELEQAYLDFTLSDTLSAKAGLFLVPVGIINETHEPPTFYGVERNPVENKIIPATWWEGGGDRKSVV